MDIEKVVQEKTEMQRHYVMVSFFSSFTIIFISMKRYVAFRALFTLCVPSYLLTLIYCVLSNACVLQVACTVVLFQSFHVQV